MLASTPSDFGSLFVKPSSSSPKSNAKSSKVKKPKKPLSQVKNEANIINIKQEENEMNRIRSDSLLITKEVHIDPPSPLSSQPNLEAIPPLEEESKENIINSSTLVLSETPIKKSNLEKNLSEGILIFKDEDFNEYDSEKHGNLYLGSSKVASNGYWLDSHVRYILNVTAEVKNYFPDKFVYKQIKVCDSFESQLGKWFDEATSFIHNALSSGDSILVHCAKGQSRSVTIVIAFALKYLKMNLSQAYPLVSERNLNKVSMNDGFKHQLMEYEKKLFKSNSINFFDKTARRLSSQKSPSFKHYFSDESEKKFNTRQVLTLQTLSKKVNLNTSSMSILSSPNSPSFSSQMNKTPYQLPKKRTFLSISNSTSEAPISNLGDKENDLQTFTTSKKARKIRGSGLQSFDTNSSTRSLFKF